MPSRLVPNTNTAHRLACLALYRAFLKQCRDFPTRATPGASIANTSPSSTLRSLVRWRFQHDKKFTNWPQIRNALHFGRTTLHLLEQAGSGGRDALETVTQIVSNSIELAARNGSFLIQLKEEQKQSKPSRKLAEGKAREAQVLDKSSYQRKPDIVPVAERPVPYEQALKHDDGRRKVPHYFVAHGIPFLRYSRHQPLSLGIYMKDQIKKHDKLWDRHDEDELRIHLADFEDAWDRQLWNDHRLHQDDMHRAEDDGRTWAGTYRAAVRDTTARIAAMDAKRWHSSKETWNVYLKEKALADEENRQRKEEGRKRWEATAQQADVKTSNAKQSGAPRIRGFGKEQQSRASQAPSRRSRSFSN